VQPPGLPAGDFAWPRDDALGVLKALEGSIIAVLQVDAYVIPYGQQAVIHTGRRAGFIYQRGERASEFAHRSRRSAAEFISAGSRDELFVMLCSGQDDAEAGHGTATVRTG
jgi:hypothetical protein